MTTARQTINKLSNHCAVQSKQCECVSQSSAVGAIRLSALSGWGVWPMLLRRPKCLRSTAGWQRSGKSGYSQPEFPAATGPLSDPEIDKKDAHVLTPGFT